MTEFSIYRKSTLGIALAETLDEFYAQGVINKDFATRIQQHFDKVINERLANSSASKINPLKAHLHTYRFCDNVWTFVLQRMKCTIEGAPLNIDGPVKIVACDGKFSQPGAAATATATATAASDDHE
ncbi:putative transcription initiation factor IIA subunit 2 [Paratrimastix pyriformis]|uniref:Transcription initiation factor IIA subunit 2 n=1 Tax=Paratrimastix pyriformis TaxID=342808 RepID=A0ABQ8UEK5_9EUKA|nr:putative transcription initiation factor IIA subunit 2 [Paratrimastix pyriformis]